MDTKRILSASVLSLGIFLCNNISFAQDTAGHVVQIDINTVDSSSETAVSLEQVVTSQAVEENNASNSPYISSMSAINLLLLSSNNDNSDFSNTATWSLSASTNRDLSNAIDGISSTRWTTRETQRSNQFYQIDFNTTKTFDRIRLDSTASNNDYPRAYEVLVSVDGSNWQSVAAGTPAQQNQIEVTFNTQNARFLRIEQHGSDSRHWWSIHELRVSLGPIEDSPTDGLHPDIVRVADIPLEDILLEPRGEAWKDSYSVGDQCYCDTTGDHDVNSLLADTPFGRISTEEACDIIGPGPGSQGNPIYNDIQCGNGPANDAGDEDYCPGRVDIGKEGCTHIGPKWNFGATTPQGDSITCSDEFGLPECMTAMSNNGGGVIHLEAKTYQLSDSLRLRDNVDIIGQGKDTVIRFTNNVANTIDEPLLLGLGVNNIELKDFTLHCSIDQNPNSNDIRNDHMGIYMDGPGDPSKGESTNNNNVRMERIEAYHCSNGMHLKGLTGFIGIDLNLHHNGNTERDLFHNIYLRRVADVHMSQTSNTSGGYYASNRGHGLRLSHIDNAYFGNLAVYDNADHGVHMTDGVFNMRFYNLRNNNNCADFAGACGEFRCYGGSENCDIIENASKEETP